MIWAAVRKGPQEEIRVPEWMVVPFAERGRLRKGQVVGKRKHNRKIHVRFTLIQGCSKVLSLHSLLILPTT